MKTKKGSLIAGITICALIALLTIVYIAVMSASVSAETVKPCDIENSYAKEAIEAVLEKGWMTASDIDGTAWFFPEKEVTRAELAKVLTAYLELDTKAHEKAEFGFADEGSIPEKNLPYIRAVLSEGYMKLYSDYTFRPDAAMPREETADIFGALCKSAVSAGKSERFSDFNTISTYFEANAKKLVDLEIMIGYPDDTFRPKQGLTREELALILHRMSKNENFKS